MPHAFTTAFPVRLLAILVSCVAAAGQGVAAPAQAVPSLNDPATAQLWPRVFYQADERARIEARRRASGDEAAPAGAPAVAVPLVQSYSLEGVAQGNKGATAWINGQMLRQGESHAGGRTVHIGPDVVHLRRAGQPDIVLRPGQRATEAGEMPQDVVPAGTVRQRLAPQRTFHRRPAP